jgi:hypothetical protein
LSLFGSVEKHLVFDRNPLVFDKKPLLFD